MPSERRSLIVLTNIPTPYRLHFFRSLHEHASARGGLIDVWFMARTEPGRFWDLDSRAFGFPHRFFPGCPLPVAGGTLHVNPGVPLALARERPDWVLLGGTWAAPTVAAVLVAASRFRKTKLVAWSEANALASNSSGALVEIARRELLALADGYALPGEVATNTVFSDWNLPLRPVLPLPNIVDERRFRDTVDTLSLNRDELRSKMEISAETMVVILPARLDESRKGVANFLSAIPADVWPRLVVLVAGDGPDRALLEGWIAANSDARARLLGNVDEQRMCELYAAADVFALPSFRDPNPLSVIEAGWAGLPLLVSKRCGNAPEAVKDGVNGWLIDPDDPATIAQAVHDAVARREVLPSIGVASRERIASGFATDRVVSRFWDALNELGE